MIFVLIRRHATFELRVFHLWQTNFTLMRSRLTVLYVAYLLFLFFAYIFVFWLHVLNSADDTVSCSVHDWLYGIISRRLLHQVDVVCCYVVPLFTVTLASASVSFHKNTISSVLMLHCLNTVMFFVLISIVYKMYTTVWCSLSGAGWLYRRCETVKCQFVCLCCC